ncbi:MAG: hypothetical protein HY717_16735 [Planctomycetes bacterium]|nr:hypothetical protein [Planctomycetota bacterium]
MVSNSKKSRRGGRGWQDLLIWTLLVAPALPAQALDPPPRLAAGPLPEGNIAFGDRLELPVVLEAAVERFQAVQFGAEADAGLVLQFAFTDELRRRSDLEAFVSRVLDSHRLLAGIGHFGFTGPGAPIPMNAGKIRLGTLFVQVVEPSIQPLEQRIRLGECRCLSPESADPAFIDLGGGLRAALEPAVVSLSIQDDPFVRGDANRDGLVDVADPIMTLIQIFLRSDPPAAIPCHDALDANDDGTADVSDAIYALEFLFIGKPPPQPPYPGRGPDPTIDILHCRHYDP